MTTLHLTIRRKLFHNDTVEPLGTMLATYSRKNDCLALGNFRKLREDTLPPVELSQMRQVVRNHVMEFLKDTRYCFLWNEDTGFETECKLI